MDRKIPIEQQRRRSIKKIIKTVSVFAVLALILIIVILTMDTGIKSSDIMIRRAEQGVLESSVQASGRIVPLYEQAIVSPVDTKIMEVYCNEGDSVEAGQSLLRLDLMSAEADCRRASDEVSMKRNEIQQTALNNSTYLTDLKMRVNVKEISLRHLESEVVNEKRLDSIGSGTGDRIRQAELACITARMELEQLKTQLANERKAHAASYSSKQLEGKISARNLEEMRRMLDDAQVKAPCRGTVTWLNKSLGASIGTGEKLAVVSDLSHFKIEGEIPESNSGKLSLGSPVNVRINRTTVKGHVATISPQSRNGMSQFTVFLDNDDAKLLRSGLRTELDIVYDVRRGVVRIPNGAYFQGPGTYKLFVKTSHNKLKIRSVVLGDSNFDYVEVKSGIKPGEEVVVSNMEDYLDKGSLRLK